MLPMQFDPVEQQTRTCNLSPIERVRECIYWWMEQDPGTEAERAAWNRFRHAAAAWLCKREQTP